MAGQETSGREITDYLYLDKQSDLLYKQVDILQC